MPHHGLRQVLEHALRRTSFDKYHESLENFFNDPAFDAQFARMLHAKRFDALSLAELFHPLYAGIYNKDVIDWLTEILEYTIHLNFRGFSDRVVVENIPYHRLFLDTLRYVNELEAESADSELVEHPMQLLTDDEERYPDIHPEYFTFKREFTENFVYEMMKIDISVRGFNTIQHVVLVNALSMHIARQLKAQNIPIDLGLVAGATLCHDIGKYGVKGDEARRIAYYHYFYTYEWYDARGLEKMGNIATNHSTWDLELYNLTIEALILIYADFRVKNLRKHGQDVMSVISLDASYQVILDKLDNVDEAKKNRYTRVYARLVDFEVYLKRLGISVDMNEAPDPSYKRDPFSHFALLEGDKVIRNIIDFSIDHNLTVMHRFSRDDSFNALMEAVRGENDKLTLRQYLDLLYEYSSYFTLKQKKMVMHFLFDLLLADADDIRRDASRLIGYLVANYDDDYKKEIPPSVSYDTLQGTKAYHDLLHTILFPNVNLLDHKERLQYNLINIHEELFRLIRGKDTPYPSLYMEWFKPEYDFSDSTRIILARTLFSAPLEILTEEEIKRVEDFLLDLLHHGTEETRLVVLDILHWSEGKLALRPRMQEAAQALIPTQDTCDLLPESFLLYKIAQRYDETAPLPQPLSACFRSPQSSTAGIFLSNLKTETPWIVKKINIEILYMAATEHEAHLLHVAFHYCNLLKVSEFDIVREQAGRHLVQLVRHMKPAEVNDIAIELLRGLEMNDYNFVRMIPKFLGEILLYLEPRELNEILDDFDVKLKSDGLETLHAILHTLGRSIELYDEYIEKGNEYATLHNKRRNRLIGLLISVISSPKLLVHTEAFAVLGSYIFNSRRIYQETQAYYLREYGKKILTLLTTEDEGFTYLSNAYSLNQIYKCITEYQLTRGEIVIPNIDKVAFFPGTFDPFSLGHLAICRDVRNLGYEVYVSIDEFSWSKKPLPYLMREKIVEMSVSAERNVYIFPSDIQMNIANEKNMQTLKELFAGKTLTLLVGADVVENASAYRHNETLRALPHLIYMRRQQMGEHSEKAIQEKVTGPYELVSLDLDLQFISSTLIRDSIDNNRDISHLVNPMVRDYIMEHKLYKRDDPFKTTVTSSQYTLKASREITQSDLDFITSVTKEDIMVHVREEKPTVLRFIATDTDELLCVVLYEKIEIIDLYYYFRHIPTISTIRESTRGPIAYLHGVFISRRFNSLREELVNEAFAHIVSHNFDNILFTNKMRYNKEYTDLLTQSGFRYLAKEESHDTMLVDSSNPVTLNLDIEKFIKKPYNAHPSVTQVIRENRKRMKETLTELFPNTLILSFTRSMINQKLIERITAYNGVPVVPTQPRKLGPAMCVPFGEHLNGEIVPNTITKTIHTEKTFSKSIENFTIKSFPYYLPLDDQCKIINAFDKPVLLVDDLLHKGYRIRVVKPALERNGVGIEKMFVGILSMKGLEFAMAENLEVDYCYFVPRLRYWFKESDLYPYIGGDMVDTRLVNGTLIPTINMLLPYVSPSFIKKGTNEALYAFSRICLENAHQLFSQLERVYLDLNGKTVSLRDIFDVLHHPRIPDYKGVEDMDLHVSASIKNDIHLLKRLEASIIRSSGEDE